ncbi:hypothetical protein NAV33_07220 [Pseudomonas stutzeri]|uniref:hypothetical protein n=1 Tax=Stutzerimonas stutzeri TaxID=316 RepID=UPI00210D6AFE|nr:hypothetical protein [Stutzerimonas stutzeri]MCQ4311684.1 hypothetical protein [Stutzerimonas stutzeri]
MINGSTINSGLINGSGDAGKPPRVVLLGPDSELPDPDPTGLVVYEQAARSYVWWLSLLVGGEDLTGRLVGVVEVDREEGAAGIAKFRLHIPEATDPASWTGKTVTLDFQVGAAIRPRFTGRVVRPTWEPRRRILTCECTDQLQQVVEGMGVEQINRLIPSYWCEDVFSPVLGRSHWDYALERLSTVPASIDCDAMGVPRVTRWQAGAPDFVFGEGSIIDDSLSVDIADLSSLVNVYEIEYSFRYSRLWQADQSYNWQHPDMGGLGGVQGWCVLSQQPSTELPDRDMVQSAISSAGQTMLSKSVFYPVPPSGSGVYCDPPFFWKNDYYPSILMGFNAVGSQRWAQPITEKYKLRLEATSSISQTGRQVTRTALGFSVESEDADAWESTPYGVDAVKAKADGIYFGQDEDEATGSERTEDRVIGSSDDGTPGFTDKVDATRRQEAGVCLLNRGKVEILATHRRSTVKFSGLTPMCDEVDLVHTVELDVRGSRARGKVQRIVDTFDMDSGIPTTQISLAISRAGGSQVVNQTPLTLPTLNAAPLPEPVEGEEGPDLSGVARLFRSQLPTYIGGGADSPPFDESWIGVTLNYADAVADSEMYSRDVRLATNEISAEKRDEQVVEAQYDPAQTVDDQAVLYEIAIPDDILEL